MNPSTEDEIRGNFHEVKSKIEDKAGQVTNHDLKSEDQAERHAGKVEKKVGHVSQD